MSSLRSFTSRAARTLFAGTLLFATTAAAMPKAGDKAPNATVEDADGRRTQMRSFFGKPVLVVYEDQGSATVNQPLKDDLSRLAKGDRYRAKVAIVPLADVSAYDFWPVKGFVKDAIRDESRKVGTPIYCDWDGSFRAAFGIRRGTSSVLLLDREGRVLVAHEGAMPAPKRKELIELLKAQLDG